MRIGIPKELRPGNNMVAGSPDTVTKLIKLGYSVCIEEGAGIQSSYFDDQYAAAGAAIVSAEEAWGSDIVICRDAPPERAVDMMRNGSMILSQLTPATNQKLLERFMEKKMTAIAMDMVPRLSRAQSLDIRSSKMNIAGYRAVIEAAEAFGRLFTGQVTAAGKVAPAKVYVIGVGVAGLAAIGTASSMGAIVSATDVRPEVADQVESLGGSFVEIPVKQESADGYAREMTPEEQAQVIQVYTDQAAKSDIVITTAQVPGKPSPLLLTAEAVRGMKPGSVIVDMGANDTGGNCELTRPGEAYTTENGVTILGYTDLIGRLPGQASQLYGQNIVNFFKLITPGKDGIVVLNEDDEIIRSMTVTLDGELMWPPPPVTVSAAKPSESVEGAEQAESGEEVLPAWRRWWWKIALGILGIALILAAPPEMTNHFIVFELAVVVGFYVITNVTHSLHTPLMSVTNAISGIIIVGAVLLVGSSDPIVSAISVVATVLASINIFGGFLVTHRMLTMFKRSSEE